MYRWIDRLIDRWLMWIYVYLEREKINGDRPTDRYRESHIMKIK